MTLSKPNAQAAASIRSLIDWPIDHKADDDGDARFTISVPDPLLSPEDANSSSSAAETPMPHVRTDLTLAWKNGDGPSNSKPNAQAAAAGRSPLRRPPNTQTQPPYRRCISLEDPHDGYATFTASAADSPMPRVMTNATHPLKSCLSTSRFLSRGNIMSSVSNGFRDSAAGGSGQATNKKNEQFKSGTTAHVAFSHLQVREYEVTLGDNPSVSSGAPLSLGWRYNPHEKISSLDDINDTNDSNSNNDTEAAASNDESTQLQQRRSISELKLSDQERLLRINPSVSMHDVHAVLQSTAALRMERTESLNEWKMDRMMKKRREMMVSMGETSQ
mmetsp:Transcript_21204/g.34673  ORF Transcript_21204/g.34673 Transcript_21204/m.34673 type:complete len:331 (-) Transcript_21204:575-1567(-)